jgi:uncharacterized membrane protein YvbJ
MFCPNCACEVVSDETKFCSKCGFTLTSVRNIVENSGEDQSGISQFQKGIRFGVKLLLIALILFPVFQILQISGNGKRLTNCLSRYLTNRKFPVI